MLKICKTTLLKGGFGDVVLNMRQCAASYLDMDKVSYDAFFPSLHHCVIFNAD